MSHVRTVLGDIPPEQLGVCYAHEHLIIDPCFATERFPAFQLDSVDKAVAEVDAFRAAGGRALVDAMPADCGRNLAKLATISRRSEVHVVAATGLHRDVYYPPGHWGNSETEPRLLRRFLADLERDGPRAGIIKLATEEKLRAREQRAFAAAAEAHRETGCPILTHTEQGTLGIEQLEMFIAGGVDLAHVCLSHLDRLPDPGYHREVLSTGVKLEYDSAFRWQAADGNPTLDLLAELAAEFPDQIMLGMDMARSSYWMSHGGGPGLPWLLQAFRGQLENRGIGEELRQRMFVTTPAATFRFGSSR